MISYNTIKAITAISIAFCAHNAQSQIVYSSQELSSTNPTNFDRFGAAVDIGEGLVIVGARLDDTASTNGGLAYVFNANTGAFIRQLEGSNITPGDEFGASVAIHGNIILVGAQYHNFGPTNSGAAYFFNASTGAQTRFVGPSDAANNDWFGESVAINSVISLVSAPNTSNNDGTRGAVFAFLNSTMKQLVKITPPVNRGNVRFGSSLAMNEIFFVVGAPGDSSPTTPFPGEAYIYSVATGLPTELLIADTPDPASQFGWDVDIDGNIVVIGAKSDDAFGDAAGAVYVFDATNGNQLMRLGSPNPEIEGNFGSSVAIGNGVIVVGADRESGVDYGSGAVYIFDSSTYELITSVLPDELERNSKFGGVIAIKDGTIVASAEHLFASVPNSGKAYLLNPYCRPDLNQDGSLNFLDVSAFLDTQLDWNDDGSFNFLDISGFLASYSDACSR
tara:strand:- start:57 stop:1400 length:1344 start_codon:yes stop_codon:yes gene_type:complete